MNKLLLLTRSHIRKNKGTCAGLIALMLIASMLIGVSLILLLDAVPLAKKEAQRLNAGDGYMRIMGGLENIDEELVNDCFGDDVEEYHMYNGLEYHSVAVPFNDASVTIYVFVTDDEAYNREMARDEIIEEDTSITSDYVILPYVFYSAGGFEIGDKFAIDLLGTKLDLKVRGFCTTPYFGGTNVGCIELIFDDDTYAELYASHAESQECIFIPYTLKDGVKQSKFEIKANNAFISKSPKSDVIKGTLSDVALGRTFMSEIIAVSNSATTSVVLIVILLMLVSSITNFVRENMKTIGALKAIGYTSSDMNRSLLFQFLLISVIGSVCGAVCSYLIMPVIAKYAVAQVGIPYHVSFNPISTAVAVAAVILYTLIVTAIALRKVRKIEPIVALREGTESHSFKKNHFALEKSSKSLNLNLGLKTMMVNRKQNIITFLVVGGIVFLCTMSLLMYENFNRNPKLEIMTFETCGAVVGFDAETKDEAQEYLTKIGGKNVREIDNFHATYNGEDSLFCYAIAEPEKLNNQNVCYKGSMPEYDNEIAVSGKFARDYGYEIGDEVKLESGDNSYTYIITGLIQSANNLGREALVLKSGAEHLIDYEMLPSIFYVDTDSSEAADELIEKADKDYGDHLVSKINFYENIEGSLSTFKGLATLMLVVIATISAIVILLVLFLLIKAHIYNKRKDYGIYKAIGYTSKDLIVQTALSFMPSIIASTLIFAVFSYFIANPYMNITMMAFGICKADFDIPIPGVAIIVVAINVLSFCFAIFEARKIKKIEAYNMLVAE